MSAGKQANLAAGSFKDPSVEIQSYFARAVVGFMGKYTLTATFRADGSNKFGKDNRYGYFPSVAAAWNITKEDFMSNLPVFDDLKLRVGYGITGNQEFAADAALDVYRYNSFGSITTLHFGNDKLKWESVKSIDVGLDFTILKGKVYGAIDYFDKRTEDPLFLRVVSQPTGQGGTQYDNLDAEVKNTGVEFSVGADLVQGKNFDWSINANWTFVKNKFIFAQAGSSPLALTGGLHGQGTSGAYSQAIAHNQPVNVYFLPIFKGFDKDGIGIYSPTPEYAGDPNPSSFLGISTDLTFFKKLTLNLGAHGSFGNKLYNNTAMSVINISNINGGRNIASGLVSSGESTANPITTSTRYLESGNYIKLHNATLRYTFGNMGALKNFNVYISGNNLFVISDYKGFDPEVNVDKALNGIPSLGVDYIGYPTQRTFLLGLSFSL
jgi:iron complex outermembrane receptor protein